MARNQPSNRVPRWLEGLDPAMPPQNQQSGETSAAVADGQQAQRDDHIANDGDAVNRRNSLDDALRNDPLAHGDVPEAIRLPAADELSASEDGPAESSSGHSVDNLGPQSSLEVLSRLAVPEIPSNIPLPAPDPTEAEDLRGAPTPEEQLQQPEAPSEALAVIAAGASDFPGRRRRPPRLTYRDIVSNAARVLEHIRDGNVVNESRLEKTSMTYFDYADDMMSEARQVDDYEDIPHLGRTPPKVKQRLIFVEDLSQKTMDALGITFSINPEFFEEHLLNSNYAGALYDQPPARTWKTANMAKSYISFRWVRPVYRQPTYFSHRDLDDLLEDCTEHLTRRGKVTTRVNTNIFRLEWGLWTDPSEAVRMKRECGLEERVSIWKGGLQDRDCEIGEWLTFVPVDIRHRVLTSAQ